MNSFQIAFQVVTSKGAEYQAVVADNASSRDETQLTSRLPKAPSALTNHPGGSS